MERLVRRIAVRERGEGAREILRREWLLTNGLGGYASGTISGSVSRRYHGYLVAALPAPYGRVLMLNHLAEYICIGNREIQFGGQEEFQQEGETYVAAHWLLEFRLENQLPFWTYEVEGILIEKSVILLHGQNTVHINYRLVSSEDSVRLRIRPSMHFRGHDQAVSTPLHDDYVLSIIGERFEISSGYGRPALRLFLRNAAGSFTHDRGVAQEINYASEAERGYDSRGVLWSSGYFTIDLVAGKTATFIASAEPWHTILALRPEEALEFENIRRNRLVSMAHPKARSGPASELVLAADQFIITPAGRLQDAARARASGDEVRTIIAGYHWFTDWGRDTMISLEGLTLTTGRYMEAGWIIRTFAHYIKNGLIPNLFPEGENEGLYHTADATLWFFHALERYMESTNDLNTLRQLLPKLVEIVDCHVKGTLFGIGMDPKDGLLKQGQEGYQLTWMDAKVEDWVVTPRRGKAVEINALWYNALRLLESWVRQEMGEEAARQYAELAERVYASFNARFWYAKGHYLYDVIDGEDGDDHSCRPNQILAISLGYPILAEERWKPVLKVVQDKLVTPVGLRSLAPGEPDYKSKYFGDLRSRDAAYHQGTVWAWLVGPFVDAWLRVYPEDRVSVRRFLEGFVPHLDEACIGTISEIFDADPPFTPRGCMAQAWSVAEVLRAWVKTAE